MRLIKTDDLDNLQLYGPILEADAPPFAILSHTWGDFEDELSFQDMADISRHTHKGGFQKVRSFCEHAKQSGYEYAWADTVCIDKTSSAELSEAINSMYRWYSISAVCYVLLQDLDLKSSSISTDELRQCRWFTRGWTLQELIAPKKVVFFNKNWDEIGSKTNLVNEIVEITGIDWDTLYGLSVKRVSIARRMSWASRRKTSRPEDLAYCLLGIFGVNMPMLYGEGERAFTRLQEEILQNSNDQSIFAWSTDPKSGVSRLGFWSLLAPSPAYFKDSWKYLPVRGAENNINNSVTSRGISINVFANLSKTRFVLNCRVANQPYLCTLPIVPLRSGQNEFARLEDPAEPGITHFNTFKDITKEIQIFVRNNVQDEDFEDQYLINYAEFLRLPRAESGYRMVDVYPNGRYDPDTGTTSASPFPNTFCGGIYYFEHSSSVCPPFMVALFADGLPGDSDCVSQDVIGVFSGPSPNDFFAQFRESISLRKYGDYSGAMDTLPGAVETITRDGLQVWKLDDSTFVRVVTSRAREKIVDSIVVAEIFAGTSWEEDILGGEIDEVE